MDMVKDPLAPVRLLEDVIKFLEDIGNAGSEEGRYQTGTPQNKYNAEKWLWNIPSIMRLDNAINQLIVAKRIAFDDPYYEAIEKKWDNEIKKVKKTLMAEAETTFRMDDIKGKELESRLADIEAMIDEIYETPEKKEEFVFNILKDVKQDQKLRDSDDEQIKEYLKIIDLQGVLEKYYQQEAKRSKDSKMKKSTIKKVGNTLDKELDIE
jgi:hypothetical protein